MAWGIKEELQGTGTTTAGPTAPWILPPMKRSQFPLVCGFSNAEGVLVTLGFTLAVGESWIHDHGANCEWGQQKPTLWKAENAVCYFVHSNKCHGFFYGLRKGSTAGGELLLKGRVTAVVLKSFLAPENLGRVKEKVPVLHIRDASESNTLYNGGTCWGYVCQYSLYIN